MTAAIFVAILLPVFVAILLPIIADEHWSEAQNRARARRLADAKMNARLLRLDI
jgi:hypothetical protein